MINEVGERLDAVIMAGDVAAVRALFGAHPELLKKSYRGFLPWLTIAAGEPNVEMVKLLIELGLDVNDKGNSPTGPKRPLDRAVMFNHVDNVRVLLEHGANPTIIDRLVISAIVGFKSNSLEMVKLLERYGVDLHKVYTHAQTGQPMNALGEAVGWGKEDVAEYLRSKGCVMPPTLPAAKVVESLESEVVLHFEENFGPVLAQSIIEIVPTEPRIAVRVIPPASDRKHITLFTTGLSNQAMQVPEGWEDYQYAELFIQLPADWKYLDIHNPNYGWPIEWLRSMAQYPYRNDTWLPAPVTILANGDPPQPLAPNAPFTALLLLTETQFTARDGRVVQLYRMMPLYTEERDLELREGTDALMRAFDRSNVSFVVDLNRKNVATT